MGRGWDGAGTWPGLRGGIAAQSGSVSFVSPFPRVLQAPFSDSLCLSLSRPPASRPPPPRPATPPVVAISQKEASNRRADLESDCKPLKERLERSEEAVRGLSAEVSALREALSDAGAEERTRRLEEAREQLRLAKERSKEADAELAALRKKQAEAAEEAGRLRKEAEEASEEAVGRQAIIDEFKSHEAILLKKARRNGLSRPAA